MDKFLDALVVGFFVSMFVLTVWFLGNGFAAWVYVAIFGGTVQ